ncbi:hypothetical protein [Silvimonas sp.]|uniref:hypothetical protein n=1 Tax=Silvimonas sp. TaxID=2650811 RepID=UPI00284A483E|nr:hypothetical protein [Silvimonas sp.]MDR3426121.1 hypothetical protein [Silvimonas sp.]
MHEKARPPFGCRAFLSSYPLWVRGYFSVKDGGFAVLPFMGKMYRILFSVNDGGFAVLPFMGKIYRIHFSVNEGGFAVLPFMDKIYHIHFSVNEGDLRSCPLWARPIAFTFQLTKGICGRALYGQDLPHSLFS